MNKSSVTYKSITYKQVREGINIPNDDYGIAAYTLTSARKKAFLENPFLTNYDTPMVVLGCVDDVVGGRAMQYPVLFKAGEDIVSCCSGSSLEVESKFRHMALATDIVLDPITNKRADTIIYSDFSEDGLKVYKALRFHLFAMRKFMQPRNMNFFCQMLGLHGISLRVVSTMANIFVKPTVMLMSLLFGRTKKGFSVEKLDIVPKWVDDIVLNDGHKYMEVHDHRWLQWNLDNMFHEGKRNINSFYAVLGNGIPVAFFMTKERQTSIKVRKIDNIITGKIVEWGIKKGVNLSESDIYKMALKTFSKDIDLVQTFTNDERTIKSLKKLCFFRHKEHYIAFKDLTKQYKDSKDPALWRLRYGYSDSIFN